MLTIKPALNLTIILFFTAYVMSSGPRCVRQYMAKYRSQTSQGVSPRQAIKQSLIQPYLSLWQSWKPVIEQGLALIRVQEPQATGI